MARYIDLTPTWPEAARIIAAALENGTGKGREAARAELFRMADLLAHFADADRRYIVARASSHAWQQDQPPRFYRLAAPGFEPFTAADDSAAALRMTKQDARQLAEDLDDYAATRGLSYRHSVLAEIQTQDGPAQRELTREELAEPDA